MDKKQLSLSLSIILTVVSCVIELPEPTAYFKSANFLPVYAGGEVNLTNQSENATEYIWTDNLNMFKTSKDLTYIYYEKGSYPITLTAINGEKSDEYTETIDIYNPSIAIKTYYDGVILSGTYIYIYKDYNDFINSENPIYSGRSQNSSLIFNDVPLGGYYFDAIYILSDTEALVNWESSNIESYYFEMENGLRFTDVLSNLHRVSYKLTNNSMSKKTLVSNVYSK